MRKTILILFFAYADFTTSSLMAQPYYGGGAPGMYQGQLLGGAGGSYLTPGGQGGGLLGQPAPATPTGNTGTDGVRDPIDPVQTAPKGGVVAATIQNSSDILPPVSVHPRVWDGAGGTFNTDSAGAGGALFVIINASTYTLQSNAEGGKGGFSGTVSANNLPAGAGGGGVGVIFNGSVLNVPTGFYISGGQGGGVIDAPDFGDGQVKTNMYAGSGALGLIMAAGSTLNNHGEVLGGDSGLGASETFHGLPGSAMYITNNTTINNYGNIYGAKIYRTTGQSSLGIIAIGDNNVINNFAGGSIVSGLGQNITPEHNQPPAIYVEGNSNTIVSAGWVTADERTVNKVIEFIGNDNTLEIQFGHKSEVPGSTNPNKGKHLAVGTNNHLILGGTPDNAFDLARIGPLGAGLSVSFQGFTDYAKMGSSTWSASGAVGDTGPWVLSEGTLALVQDGDLAMAESVTANATFDISQITADSTTINNLSGNSDGRINLGAKTLLIQQNVAQTFAGIISGMDGGVTFNGPSDFTLTGANTYSGLTTVTNSTLFQGAANAFSPVSSYEISDSGKLKLNGFNTTMANLNNSGEIDWGTNSNTVLEITGDYVGNDGILLINSVLGDDNSVTDKLEIDGDSSGTGKIKVTNLNGSGANTTNGIEIIHVGGTSDGVFTLESSFTTKDGVPGVIGGAFVYTLVKGAGDPSTGGNWYLNSGQPLPDDPVPPPPSPIGPSPVTPSPDTPSSPVKYKPRYNPGTPVYEGYMQAMQALNELPSLQQRIGSHSLYTSSSALALKQGDEFYEARPLMNRSPVWARIEGTHSRFKSGNSTTGMKQDVNLYLMQAGVDAVWLEDENGTLITGFTGQYGKIRGSINSDHGDGSTDVQGWGLGGTLTWFGSGGFYLDSQAQVMWYESDLHSSTANNKLIQSNNGVGYALSLEAGKRVDIDANWSFRPQAQFVWSSVNFDTFKDSWGASVNLTDGDSLNGRVGISANYHNAWQDDKGQLIQTNLYTIANLYQEFYGATKVAVADYQFSNVIDRTWGGIGAGGSYGWADNKYIIYGEGSVNTSLNHIFADYTVKGTVGFKITW